MRKYSSNFCSIYAPENWKIEEANECTLQLYSNTGGNLKIDGVLRQKEITKKSMIESCDFLFPHRNCVIEEDYGEFKGLHLIYSEKKVFWRQWWCYKVNIELSITYHCPLLDKDNEISETNQILSTLVCINSST